ncbi:TPA: ion transporter [Candidatus Woesearchaeota archaeon]|nr:ion transporter [Candidatus Woesearchaeota archaeon]
MKKWLHKIEVIVDKAILPCIAVLLVIIVLELFFRNIAEHYHTAISIADYFIVSIFVADLVFKYLRVRQIPLFLRTYWLDILAVFPFILLFRAVEGVYGLFVAGESIETFASLQSVFHEGLEVEKEVAKITEEAGKITRGATRIGEQATQLSKGASQIATQGELVGKEAGRLVREAEEAGKVARTIRFARFSRFLRVFQRLPRLLKGVAFFERPTGRHHVHEFIKARHY